MGPARRQDVTDQADQRVERRVPVRLFARERPEPGEDVGVGQQLRPGVDLPGPGRRRTFLLDQLLPGPGGRQVAANRAGSARARNQRRSRASRPSV